MRPATQPAPQPQPSAPLGQSRPPPRPAPPARQQTAAQLGAAQNALKAASQTAPKTKAAIARDYEASVKKRRQDEDDRVRDGGAAGGPIRTGEVSALWFIGL